MEEAKLPLEGYRVIDWTVWQAGPVATAMLGDLGAEVIKIEDRVRGDYGRGIFSVAGLEFSDVPNAYFEANNRNKKSLTLDVSKAEGREVLYDLVRVSDVFVTNFRPSVTEKVGLGYETLSAVRPDLIYGAGTAYGSKGPEADARAYDLMGQARSGIMHTAAARGAPPQSVSGAISDQMGAGTLAYGILAALLARERHGCGQYVDASLLGGMLWLQGLSVAFKLMIGEPLPRSGRVGAEGASNPLWNWYRCADDRWIALAMPEADRHWPEFIRVIGRPDLGEDERFVDQHARTQNKAACTRVLEEIFESKPRSEWLGILAEGEDLVYTPVQSIDDVPDDAQALANEYITEFDHPSLGRIKVPGFPVGLSETPCRMRMPAPEFGQHTEEILLGVLGYSWEDIGQLQEHEAI